MSQSVAFWLALSCMALLTMFFAGSAAVGLTIGGAGVGAFIAAGLRPTQRFMSKHDETRLLRVRRDAREQRLYDAQAPRTGLEAMTALVDQIEQASPSFSALHDLEGLLDHYAEVTLASARCTAVLATNPARLLVRSLQSTPDGSGSLRRVMLERRLEHLIACEQRSEQLESELATVAELLGYLAQRALLDHLDERGDDMLEPRLAAIDAELATSEAPCLEAQR